MADFGFNTQPPEGGWLKALFLLMMTFQFQHTAARRRLAKTKTPSTTTSSRFNTQPPEGGWKNQNPAPSVCHSFNTQPPEGGWRRDWGAGRHNHRFQHTAARRRLGRNLWPVSPDSYCFNTQPPEGGWPIFPACKLLTDSFNTQPPEGGWYQELQVLLVSMMFQHTAARRRLDP